MNTIFASATACPEIPGFSAGVLMISGALLALTVMLLVAGFNAARTAATTYEQDDPQHSL